MTTPKRQAAPARAVSPVSYVMTRLGRQVGRTLGARVARQSGGDVTDGLSGPHIIVLQLLEQEPGLSSAQLARRSFVTAQSTNAVVRDLEDRGLLAREPDTASRRILRAQLTDAGRDALRIWNERIAALEEELLAGLSEADVARLRTLLEHCAGNLGLIA